MGFDRVMDGSGDGNVGDGSVGGRHVIYEWPLKISAGAIIARVGAS